MPLNPHAITSHQPRPPTPRPDLPRMTAAQGFLIPGYEVQRMLGEGGMASVWLGVESETGKRVAIKLLSRGRGDDAAEKRFLMEGETLARLPHPNIVQVLEVVHEAERSYIVMECLEGGVLSKRMSTGWLTLGDHVGFIAQIAGALQYAHENGVIHRDLKPDNILFRDARTPVLTDFGIARLRRDLTDTRITETGMVIGTPTYMSPEQATGGEVDGRSDQYSLGVLFFEMLAGKPPFVGETAMQVAFAHVHQQPPSLPSGYDFLEPIVMKMLSKNPKDRFPDLKAFVAELKGVLVGSSVLQKRLKIDPSADISEQLRAIGFSDHQLKLRVAGPMLTVGLPEGALKHALLEGSSLELEPVTAARREVVKDEKGPMSVPAMLVIAALFIVAAVAVVGIFF
jgi:serine/threonine-protein kinase PpkA